MHNLWKSIDFASKNFNLEPDYHVKETSARQRKTPRKRRSRDADSNNVSEPVAEDVAVDESEPPAPLQDVADINVEEDLAPTQDLAENAEDDIEFDEGTTNEPTSITPTTEDESSAMNEAVDAAENSEREICISQE